MGELLTARDDGVLVLSAEPVLPDTRGTRIVLVPFWMMRSIRLEQVGSFTIRSEGAELDEARKTRLRSAEPLSAGRLGRGARETLESLAQEAVDVPARQD
ncbi:MAG: hypothetical protein U5K76_09180 [Woeseiaceae bacterium]|nr:hypothetical protein [Woeseiaceae bacterium]